MVVGYTERAARIGTEIVILSIGSPSSDRQQRIVGRALGIAEGGGVGVDAILVPNPRDIPDYLEPGDSVGVFGSPLERWQVERTLGPLVDRNMDSTFAGWGRWLSVRMPLWLQVRSA